MLILFKKLNDISVFIEVTIAGVLRNKTKRGNTNEELFNLLKSSKFPARKSKSNSSFLILHFSLKRACIYRKF